MRSDAHTAVPGSEPRLVLTRRDGVAMIRLGNGYRHNALRRSDWGQLAGLVHECAADPHIRALLITGSTTTFCAGSDLNEWLLLDQEEIDAAFVTLEQCFAVIERAPIPVIAAVEGVAAGAGCQLALAADLLVVGAEAQLSMPIARLGIHPSAAFAARLVHRAGRAVAADLLLTGRSLRGDAIVSHGFASRLAPAGGALSVAQEMARGLTKLPAAALAASKRAVAGVAPSAGVAGTVVSAGEVSAARDYSTAPAAVLQHAVRGFLGVAP